MLDHAVAKALKLSLRPSTIRSEREFSASSAFVASRCPRRALIIDSDIQSLLACALLPHSPSPLATDGYHAHRANRPWLKTG